MTIQAVFRNIQFPALEPFNVRVFKVPFQHFVPFAAPHKGLGHIGPETFGIHYALVIGLLIVIKILDLIRVGHSCFLFLVTTESKFIFFSPFLPAGSAHIWKLQDLLLCAPPAGGSAGSSVWPRQDPGGTGHKSGQCYTGEAGCERGSRPYPGRQWPFYKPPYFHSWHPWRCSNHPGFLTWTGQYIVARAHCCGYSLLKQY